MMQQKGMRSKKSLGQHFLNDQRTIQRIFDSLNLKAMDTVLEIGCGTGALTRRLVGKTKQYLGVELDTSLFRQLERDFAQTGVVFLNQDILTLDWKALQQKYLSNGSKFKVVGNLPYYISSPIIRLLARYSDLLEMAVIMLQAEVADRLTALPATRDYGVLTLLAQYYFDCEFLFSAGPQAFRPRPEVTSKVVRLMPRSTRPLPSNREEAFFEFVKRCFSQRRKTLRNCLKEFQAVNGRVLEEFLRKREYSPDVRAEGISLDDFVRLHLALSTS